MCPQRVFVVSRSTPYTPYLCGTVFRHARQQQRWGLLSSARAPPLLPETEGEFLLGILKRDSEFRVTPTSSAQPRSVASNTLPHQQTSAQKVFPKKIALRGSTCTPFRAIACVVCDFQYISLQVTSYTCRPWRSWRCDYSFVGYSSEQRKDEFRKARAARRAQACITASISNKGGLAVALSAASDNKLICDPAVGSIGYSTGHRSTQADHHTSGSILSSEELLRVLRSVRGDRATGKTSPSTYVSSPLGSRPLRHACLCNSLLHHLRRSSPECYSSLHLYAAAGLPLEPLLPELPCLVLKLLKTSAFASTRELAMCLHACATLLRKAGLRGERDDDTVAKTASSAECASDQLPADQAASAEEAGEVWLAVCLAFEAEFSRRLYHQFEHTWEYLQRVDILPSQHRSDDWREEKHSHENKGFRNKESSFASAPQQQEVTAKNGSPISSILQEASSLQGGDSSCTPDGGGGRSPPVRNSHASCGGLPSPNESTPSAAESSCPGMASCIGAHLAGEVIPFLSSSCCSRVRPRASASDTTPVWSSVRDDTRTCRHVRFNTSTVHVTDEKVRMSSTSNQQALFPSEAVAGKNMCDTPIPYPHLVVPQDLSMCMSSYVVLAKHNQHRVSESLVAASACYLFLYVHHSSSHAFSLAASVIAKMAATLVAGSAAGRHPSTTAAATFFRESPVQPSTCVLTSPYIGPFTTGAMSPSVSKRCRRLMACCATQSRGTEEISSVLNSSLAPSVSDTSCKEGNDEEGESLWGRLPYMKLFFSPLQLLAAVVHHWVVEKADRLRSHDWVCVINALRYLLRLRAGFPPLAGPAVCRATSLEDRCHRTAGGANGVHPVHTVSCEKSEGAVGDGAVAARIAVASLDAVAAGPATQGEEAFASNSASHSTSIRLPDQCGAPSAVLPEYAGGSTKCSASQVAVENVFQGTSQFHIPKREYAFLRAHAAANTLCAARASQRAVAAAAAAFPMPHSPVSPFSEIAAAVSSCFPAWPGTAQQVFDLYESCNVGSCPLLYRNSLGRDGKSGGETTTPAVRHVPAFSRFGPGWVVSLPAGGAASIAGPCRLFAGMAEFEQAEVRPPHDNLQSAVALSISPPSADVFLQALRRIVLHFQQHLSLSMTLTSLPAVALAVVELHSTLIEKVRGLQDNAALWQRPRGPSSRLVAGPHRLPLEKQGREEQAVSMEIADTGGEAHGGKGAARNESQTQQVSDRVSCGSRAVSVNWIFGMFAPVYELLCRTRDAECMFNALSANQGSQFSGSVIFLSALVETLRLGDVEHADQKTARGGATAAAPGGGLELRNASFDTRRRPSAPCCAAALPPLGSAESAAVLSRERACTTQRLRSRVLCLFRYAVSKVFLRQPSYSACTSAGSHSLGGSPSTMSLINVADTSPASCPSAGCDALAVSNVDVAAQVSKMASSNVLSPHLAWYPTSQDLVDLVEAACYLLSPSDSLDGCDTSAPTAELLKASTPAVSRADSNLDADVSSAGGAFSRSQGEKNCYPILPQSFNKKARTTKAEERHSLLLLLRACCNHVVGVLKSQQQGRMGENPPEPRQAARPHEQKMGTTLRPRDVSSLAVHFYRCGLFSNAEFEAFGQYIMAGSQVADGVFPGAAVFSGYDFLCLLQILVRPELPEGFNTSPSSSDGRVLLKERHAQYSAWQSPLAARLAVSMLDGMLPRLIRTFDDTSLARLALWLGNQFQRLQIYDRCSRSTVPGEHPCSGGSTFRYSRSLSHSLYSGASAPVDDVSITSDRIFRLQLPAMRGLLERATRCLVHELLLRFCGLQVGSRSALRVDSARFSERPSVSGATKTMSTADRALSAVTRAVTTAVPSAPSGQLPALGAPPFACSLLSGDVSRLCTKAEVYVTLLLGLSKLPRDLVLLPESRLALAELKKHLKANKRRCSASENFATISAMGAATVDTPMDAGLPAGVLLLHTLLSKPQLDHFFVPCVTLTWWELKVFFSALQHLPLLTAYCSFPNTVGSERPRKSACGEYGRQEFTTLREHVLRTVFQATPLESLWKCSKV